ncbi:MAG: hypothetical protein ACPG32_06580, partial [Akkermansiaceae bacterium]
TESAEGIKGDTASNVQKPATLETGMVVQVPLFIKEGSSSGSLPLTSIVSYAIAVQPVSVSVWVSF